MLSQAKTLVRSLPFRTGSRSSRTPDGFPFLRLQQGLNVLHCAAQNNHVTCMKFVHDSLEGFDFSAVEKVTPPHRKQFQTTRRFHVGTCSTHS